MNFNGQLQNVSTINNPDQNTNWPWFNVDQKKYKDKIKICGVSGPFSCSGFKNNFPMGNLLISKYRFTRNALSAFIIILTSMFG